MLDLLMETQVISIELNYKDSKVIRPFSVD